MKGKDGMKGGGKGGGMMKDMPKGKDMSKKDMPRKSENKGGKCK